MADSNVLAAMPPLLDRENGGVAARMRAADGKAQLFPLGEAGEAEKVIGKIHCKSQPLPAFPK